MEVVLIGGPFDGKRMTVSQPEPRVIHLQKRPPTSYAVQARVENVLVEIEYFCYHAMLFRGCSDKTFRLYAIADMDADEVMRRLIQNYKPETV